MAKRSVSVTHGKADEMLTGLFEREGRYSIKRRVPVDLAEHYSPKKIIVRALGTGEYKEARLLLPIAWQKLDEEFALLRATATATATASTPLVHSAPQPALAARKYGPDDVEPLSRRLLGIMRRKRAEALTTGTLDQYLSSRREILKSYEDVMAGLEEPFGDIYLAEATRNALRWFLNGIDAPLSAAVAPSDGSDKAAASTLTLHDTFIKWSLDGAKKHRTIGRTEKIIAEFQEVAGVKPIGKYVTNDVEKFKDYLLAKGKTPQNVNVVIPMLGTVFHYARKRLRIIDNSPTSDIRVNDTRKSGERRRTFKEDELNTLYSSPIYSANLRPEAGGGEASYWLPILALFTGARQTELGQLYTDDIILERYRDHMGLEASAWVLRIVENSERRQFVKNEGSERRIPLHQCILDRGFIAYRDRIETNGCGRLFPDITPNSVNELMGNWSKWFGRYRRSIGLTDKRTPFHSLRHAFKHYARLSGIHKEVHNEITGHETGDVSDSYGGLSYPLAPLVEAIGRYSVPGVILPASPPLKKQDR